MTAAATVTVDETARILAECGNPVSIAEYAIHEAMRRYREATAGLRCSHCMQAPARAFRAELAEALAAFDHDRRPEDRETGVITGARERHSWMTEADTWVDRALSPGRACRA